MTRTKLGWTALAALPLALTLGTAPAQATLVLLDFEGNACSATDGGPANQACATGDFIGGDYGSTTGLTVSYDSAESTGSHISLQYNEGSYGNPGSSGKAKPYGGGGPADELSMIYFTPDAGYEVSFLSFEQSHLSATYDGHFIFKVFDPLGNELYSGGISDSHSPNTDYFSGMLTFAFGNGGQGAVAIDNLRLDLRQVSSPGAVPEPASWALMIGGFGLAGGTMRTRRQRKEMLAA